jgi:hypothetical protein
MADRPIDPMSLTGEALRRWYQRSPAEVEQERQNRRDQRYRDFFGERAKPHQGIGLAGGKDIDPGFSRDVGRAGKDVDPGFAWAPVSPNKWRRQPLRPDGVQPLGTATAESGAVLDRGLAGPNDGGQVLAIGNPHNPRLKSEYIKKYGSWPKTEDGRDYDVAHQRAIADGGTNTLDNIEPMHPDEHTARHRNDGDYSRWGRRPGIARAFGGTVARALGPLGILSDITGVLSGRIRTDSFDNFSSDMMGWPSQEDQRKALEHEQRQLNPKWKPGDPIVI